ncbi:MAG: hypothetical protein HQM04_19160 [Magnetococcales bacterium]|nr:hypothetical protein [Magnetococcales bacterium]MBF0117147.1 hypothetical protein [Magnetococcales bacterium]
MSAKEAQKRRSQERAARKRAKSKPTARRCVAVMTTEGFRRVATPIASEIARHRGVSEEVVVAVMEQMAEDGCLGLDERGQLAKMDG